MLLVLPFNSQDARLALMLAKYMQYVGPYKSHELLLVAPNDCEESLNQIREAIGDQFARVHTHYIPLYKSGWPSGCNIMFHATAYHISTKIDCDCWYFFEPDNTPVKPNWLNTLHDEYRRTQRPFMGVIHPSYYRRGIGTPEERFIQDGEHLVGTSIYPKNMPQYSKALFKTIPVAPIPWDVYLQWDIIKWAAGTTLIHHEWRTINYRRDKKTGLIKGERPPPTVLPYEPAPLRPDAVVHHGCKDGSLMHIMRGMFTSRGQGLVDEPEPALSSGGNLA